MQKRITLRDVAAKLGVHFTTVSLSLRNHPRIPKETRDRIREMADKMGYSPDPILSALNTYRIATRPAAFHGTLGWLCNHPETNGWRKSRRQTDYFEGAQARAKEVGYGFEEFWCREPAMNHARLSRVLRARNITGLVITSHPEGASALSLDWKHFAAVNVGYTPLTPRLHTITMHYYDTCIKAVGELRARGYRRIGLVISAQHDESAEHLYSGGYRNALETASLGDKFPILYLEGREHQPFVSWYKEHRPDAIVTMPYYDLPALLSAVRLKTPRDIGVCTLIPPYQKEAQTKFAHMKASARDVGVAAVNLLTNMMQHDMLGVPESPYRVLIESHWHDGDSVRSGRR